MKIRVALVLLSILLLPASAVATSCLGFNPAEARQAAKSAKAVFLGEVMDLKVVNGDGGPIYQPTTSEATFLVKQSWKGVDKKEVKVITTTCYTCCGAWFQLGREYILFVEGDDFRVDSSDIVEVTKRMENDKQILSGSDFIIKKLGKPVVVFK